MILYITRKFPPSVGGMQRFNFKLVSHLGKITDISLISWGGNQSILPFFLIFAFVKALFICTIKPIKCIYVSDGLLSPLGLILKLITRKPTVANIHGRDIAYKLKLYQIIVPWSLRRLDKIICVSHELRNECIKRGVPDKILHVIPNGVDIDDFDTNKNSFDKKKLGEMIGASIEDRKILLTVGRLVPKKGVDNFIANIFPKIIEKDPKVIYLIAGDGPLNNKIRSIINEKGLQNNVFLLGKISMNSGQLASIYGLSDIFVMPNVPVSGDMEGFGIVALEAGAAGLPVVASKVDGITDAIKDGRNGFLINHDDHDRYAKKIIDLIQNKDHRKDFGLKTKTFVRENYSWPDIAKQYFTHFEDLMTS